jgi:hypothetical protein
VAEHSLVKPERLAAHAVGVLHGEVVVPNLMTKHGIEDFRGSKDDTITRKVPGTLPFREYEWRSGAGAAAQSGAGTTRAGLIFDEYAETTVDLRFGGNVYSGVIVTDEQAVMDFGSYTALLNPQAEAVGRGLETKAAKYVETGVAPVTAGWRPSGNSFDYPVTIGIVEGQEHAAFVEARRCLNLLRAPGPRIFLAGSNVEAALLNNDKFNRADSVGDAAANTALRAATIRNWMGFTVVTSLEIDPDTAIAFVPSAFNILNAAPFVPDSVPFGATASFNGFSLRWLRDYDTNLQQDRSTVNTWYGFAATKDTVVGYWDTAGTKPGQVDDVFVRGIKLELGGTSVYPEASGDDAIEALGTLTGLSNPASS